ncbi:hypothetical protein Lepto7375DRAFT_0893 [Leptolyngbya sp. PCC 7375]|nr:hypothetical protein Lepto7375DRAFT_0893 [Leptolyngbya sp. PCC 7375]
MFKALLSSTLLAAVSVATIRVSPSSAAIIKPPSGNSYEVTTFTGTFLELEAFTKGLDNLAPLGSFGQGEIASLVKTDLGTQTFPDPSFGSRTAGPLFVYRRSPDLLAAFWDVTPGTVVPESLQTRRFSRLETHLYGVVRRATDEVPGVPDPTPGPSPIPGDPDPIPTPALLPGLIGMGAAALRKKRSEIKA